jgi:ubiquinone/menaquinone biosynthesis C-methylase UbiE
MTNTIENWKKTLKVEDGIFQISLDRKFTHEETDYGSEIDFNLIKHGQGVIELMKALNCDFNGPAIEIGAGNGLISVSLAESHVFPDLMITDASSSFVKICKKNINTYSKSQKNVSYGVFNGDDLSILPDDSFSLICMANALHHIEFFEDFIMLVSKKLKKSGAFICQEPISDGFLMLGVIAKAYQLFAPKLSRELSEKLEELALTMSNSNRRNLNKSNLEDKHIFNIYELQQIASKAKMKLDVFPSVSLSTLANGIQESKNQQESFSVLCKGYIEHCLNWKKEIKKELYIKFDPLLAFIDTACGGAYYPPVTGVFCMVKDI